jgi:hypothetical protein
LVPAQAGDGDGTERGRLGLAIGSRRAAGLRRLQGLSGTVAGRAGRRGREVKTGLFQDQSESPTAPSGRPDPARPRGNVDRDETSPQSPSLETNGSAERSGLAETQTHYPRSSGLGPDRSAPPHQLGGFPREAAKPCPRCDGAPDAQNPDPSPQSHPPPRSRLSAGARGADPPQPPQETGQVRVLAGRHPKGRRAKHRGGRRRAKSPRPCDQGLCLFSR